MKKYFISIGILVFAFVFLLLLSFLFDDQSIKKNVSNSLENYNFVDDERYGLHIDNYTDMIMLNVITYGSNNSLFKRTFGNEYGVLYIDKYGENEVYWNQYENLKASLSGTNDDTILYGRFWHGYQIILKSLLSIFTYQQSLVFLTIIGIILILISCILVYLKLGIRNLIIYILSLLSLNIYAFNTCYQFFFSMILMIIFNIIVLLKYNEKMDINVYMFIFGCLTSYLLYISFPLITLAYPLLILITMKLNKENIKLYKENVIFVFKNSVIWLLGYIITFLIKWILGTIFVGRNFVEDALLSINQRLGIVFSFNYFDVLKLNLYDFFSHKFNVIICIIAVVLILVKFRKDISSIIKIISPVLLIFLMPFIWMLLCNNHSGVHYWMVSRLFSISLYCLLMIVNIFYSTGKIGKLSPLNVNDYFCLISFILFFILYNYNLFFIIETILLVILLKPNNKVKIFGFILVIASLFLLFNKLLSKNTLNNETFYLNTYNELFHKAKDYGGLYIANNNITTKTKVDIKDLIYSLNSDSVFLLSCKGYVILDENDVKPYINCNDVIVTDGYEY